MLTELRIKNFAIIDALSLPLASGFNVLSGETGAGKSIIVGALGLLLGERANVDVIRTGADRATVEGVFDVSTSRDIAAALDARGIEIEDGLVVLKREVAAGGRSRSWINGSAVTLGILGECGRLLVSLHGQHEAQTLLEPDAQRRILDAFAGANGEAQQVRAVFAEISAVRTERAELARKRAEIERRASYLRHTVEEIEQAHLTPGEDVRLDDEASRLEHADELRSLTAAISAALDGDAESILPRLAALGRSLVASQRHDPTLARVQESFDSGYYALEALARELADYAESVDLDPARLDGVRRRRELLHSLTRKYGATVDAVLEEEARARAELDVLGSADVDLQSLNAREESLSHSLAQRAAALSALRHDAATRLDEAVGVQLPALGMEGARFFATLVDRDAIGPDGAEDVLFCVSLNTGHERRALARVASGGELSRIMLALETILSELEQVPTLIFDEVDAGIGGRVGHQLGIAMRGVAANRQVVAISHLPQIAARAHHHIVVTKAVRGGVTSANAMVVGGDDRVIEIARMLGGDTASDVSRAHARELLDQAPERTAATVTGARAKRRAS